MIQTNAAVNTGNSGGPLINQYGQGHRHHHHEDESDGTKAEATVEGLGFALPTAQVAYVVNDIMAFWREFKGIPTFGLRCMTTTDESGISAWWCSQWKRDRRPRSPGWSREM